MAVILEWGRARESLLVKKPSENPTSKTVLGLTFKVSLIKASATSLLNQNRGGNRKTKALI
jgi:hypothetical protein